MTTVSTSAFQAPRVPDLSADDQQAANDLFGVLAAKTPRLEKRRDCYDSRDLLKHVGETIPPHMRNIGVALGWSAKAVDSFSLRTVLDEVEGVGEAAPVVAELFAANGVAAESSMVHTEALISSVAFLFVTKGGAGEPRALITPRSARQAAATWDTRKRRVNSALSISHYDDQGQADDFQVYLDGRVFMCRREDGAWDVTESRYSGGIPVFPISFRADLDRPFGRSRITRPVMYLQSAAMRTMLRTEVGAEFYNMLQRYVLGADEDAFRNEDGTLVDRWKILAGGLLTLGRDEDGNIPEVGEFRQQSTEPNHSDLRVFAQQFSAETGLPLRSLGVVGDNPESSDAIREAKDDMVVEIEHWQRTALRPAWEAAFARAVAVAEPDMPSAEVRARFLPAARVSPSAGADAYTKISSVNPSFAASDVGLQMAGLSPEQIVQFREHDRQNRGRSLVELVTQGRTLEPESPGGIEV